MISTDSSFVYRVKHCLLIAAAAALGISLPIGPATGGSFDGKRKALVRRIERDVRALAPDADDTQMARALAAITKVPREAFVLPEYRKRAYGNTPLPIGYDQTISDAYVVALMTAVAHVPDRANMLDVGTGSGYQAAVLAVLGAHVTSIEIVQPLADSARERLARLGYREVEVRTGDGFAGAPDHAPFDAIIVAAGAAAVPSPLIDQLKVGGRIVMPIGASWTSEELLVITKTGPDTTIRCSLGWIMFVPLTGQGARSGNAAGLLDKTIPRCFSGDLVTPVFVSAKP